MSAQVFYAYKCPQCNSTVNVGISVVAGIPIQQKPRCLSCGVDMEPDQNGRTTAMNVFCRNCNSKFGMITSDTCPNCGKPFS